MSGEVAIMKNSWERLLKRLEKKGDLWKKASAGPPGELHKKECGSSQKN